MDLLIRMTRPDLSDLPAIELPAGYRLVCAADLPDPVPAWAELISQAFDDRHWTVDHVTDAYICQPQYDPEGTFFVLCGDEIVSSAFAWVDEAGEAVEGRVHWVASLPAHRQKGLAGVVVTAVLGYFKERGFARAFLETQPTRLPAIRVYLRLGFRPDLRHEGTDEDEQAAWREVMALLA